MRIGDFIFILMLIATAGLAVWLGLRSSREDGSKIDETETNPATGLPIFGGLDTDGNPMGMDRQNDFRTGGIFESHRG